MPWYRTGTVAITAGQTTVTGTGTGFSANGRVGDGFLGPDGRWYEITNIASNAVLSILPAYQGATVSGGSYAIAPLQGYPKTLTDKFNDIANQWGATLAGLGTVSTENVVPVAKGGTGAITAADARSSLGLGSAATATVTTSTSDGVAGRVLRVGDHGLGGSAVVINATDANALETSGFYRVSVSGGQGPLPVNANGYLDSRVFSSTYRRQTYAVVTTGVEYTRFMINGTWLAWYRDWTAMDIVGAVSQSGGVPTGGIIERGSNANGEYTRLADGTQFCFYRGTALDCNATSLMGSTSWFRTAQITWTYPIAFAAGTVPNVVPGGERGTNSGMISGVLSSSPTRISAISFAISTLGDGTAIPCLTAVGRWFV